MSDPEVSCEVHVESSHRAHYASTMRRDSTRIFPAFSLTPIVAFVLVTLLSALAGCRRNSAPGIINLEEGR